MTAAPSRARLVRWAVPVAAAAVVGVAGTVVQNSDLGLPALPTSGPGRDSTSPLSLLTGSHTLRVWYAGEAKQRLALLGRLGETDVIHNGRDVWLWSSGSNSAIHYTLPAGQAAAERPAVPSPLTPQEAA